VFKTLRDEHLKEILEIELTAVQARIWFATTQNQFTFKTSPRTREALLAEGIDPRYGARHLKRAIERNIVHPLANLVATEQVRMHDEIMIDFEGELPSSGEAPDPAQGHYTFIKIAEGVTAASVVAMGAAGAAGSPAPQTNRIPLPPVKKQFP
jgi:hypothetical protein